MFRSVITWYKPEEKLPECKQLHPDKPEFADIYESPDVLIWCDCDPRVQLACYGHPDSSDPQGFFCPESGWNFTMDVTYWADLRDIKPQEV